LTAINPALISVVVVAVFGLGFVGYGRFLAGHIFKLDNNRITPAHQYEDGIDYIPTPRWILWGHHFASVAGAAPIIGPAIAVIWGWLPALLWVVLGTIFIAGMHDMGTLWASLRHEGRSMPSLAGRLISPRARALFLLIVLFLVIMVNAVFAAAIAQLFISTPESVLPYWLQIPVALTVGVLIYRYKASALMVSVLGLLLMFALLGVGIGFPMRLPQTLLGLDSKAWWVLLMLIYGAIASRLPVWLLLQPRDFMNSHMLFVGLLLLLLGLWVGHPPFSAPAINASPPPGTPPLWPLLFITIACGAISGFHGLISSGTTSKQLDKEKDALVVGYGGAMGEGLLAMLAIMATTAGIGGVSAWNAAYGDWTSVSQGGVSHFVTGAAHFLGYLGIPDKIGSTFISVMVIAFAATSLDTSMRLQRFLLAEIGTEYRISWLQRVNVSTLIGFSACVILAFFADPEHPGQGGMILWPLFGTTNQLTAALSMLMMLTLLYKLDRARLIVWIPFLWVLVMTTWSMLLNLLHYFRVGNELLLVVGGIIMILNLWLILEGFYVLRFYVFPGLDRKDETR